MMLIKTTSEILDEGGFDLTTQEFYYESPLDQVWCDLQDFKQFCEHLLDCSHSDKNKLLLQAIKECSKRVER